MRLQSSFARKLYRDIFIKNMPTSAQEEWEGHLQSVGRKKKGRVLAQVRMHAACSEQVRDYFTREFRLPANVFRYVPFVALECEAREADRVCEYLRKKDSVVYAAPARILHIPELLPGVGGFPVSAKVPRKMGDCWHLDNIGARKANEVTKGEGVQVGVIDTGADYTHQELEARFGSEKGYNFVDGSEDPYDGNGHGTHVSGIIAGKEVGVAPACTLYALKVLDDEGFGSEADVLAGIEWAIDRKLDVINMSLGSPQYSYFEDQVIQEAHKRGIIVVAAAGNEYYGPSYPAALEHVIGVAAVDRHNEHAEFSNIYSTNDISSPGVNVFSCVPGGYQEFSGTSMASPGVTGSQALARSVRKGSPKELEAVMKETAQALGSSSDPDNAEKYGAGLVRADNLVNKLVGSYSATREVRLG